MLRKSVYYSCTWEMPGLFYCNYFFAGPLLSYFSYCDNVNCIAFIISLKGQTLGSVWKGKFDNLQEKKPNKIWHLFKAYAEFLTLSITQPSCSFPQLEKIKIIQNVVFN